MPRGAGGRTGRGVSGRGAASDISAVTSRVGAPRAGRGARAGGARPEGNERRAVSRGPDPSGTGNRGAPPAPRPPSAPRLPRDRVVRGGGAAPAGTGEREKGEGRGDRGEGTGRCCGRWDRTLSGPPCALGFPREGSGRNSQLLGSDNRNSRKRSGPAAGTGLSFRCRSAALPVPSPLLSPARWGCAEPGASGPDGHPASPSGRPSLGTSPRPVPPIGAPRGSKGPGRGRGAATCLGPVSLPAGTAGLGAARSLTCRRTPAGAAGKRSPGPRASRDLRPPPARR